MSILHTGIHTTNSPSVALSQSLSSPSASSVSFGLSLSWSSGFGLCCGSYNHAANFKIVLYSWFLGMDYESAMLHTETELRLGSSVITVSQGLNHTHFS